MGARAGRKAQATRGARRATPAPRYSRAMERTFLVLGAISAGISVAAGAFGAHALRARLSPDLLAVFETGARYAGRPGKLRPSDRAYLERRAALEHRMSEVTYRVAWR